MQQIVHEVTESAGITKRVSPHLLRYTIAQHLLERGMLMDQVQRFLGHASIHSTQIYASATTTMVRDSYRHALEGTFSSWGRVDAPRPAPARRDAAPIAGPPTGSVDVRLQPWPPSCGSLRIGASGWVEIRKTARPGSPPIR